MNILVRLPNWLGDVVMSAAFINALKIHYPEAAIHVIIKKGLEPILDFFPTITSIHTFKKDEHKRLPSLFAFGKNLKHTVRPDLFFSLPDSFSSAVIGYASGAKQRVGFRSQMRSPLLTHAYKKKKNLHRVREYLDLMEQFTGKTISPEPILRNTTSRGNYIVVNFNSEATSRRMPEAKAISLLEKIVLQSNAPVKLIGAASDEKFINSIAAAVNHPSLENLSGKTTLYDLAKILRDASVFVTTDSGPAHLANILGTPTVVLFGAGNEFNTAPFFNEKLSIIRAGQLPCEPCVKNKCVLYGIPKCMELLDEERIVREMKQFMLPS